jgi:hypothetical protein
VIVSASLEALRETRQERPVTVCAKQRCGQPRSLLYPQAPKFVALSHTLNFEFNIYQDLGYYCQIQSELSNHDECFRFISIAVAAVSATSVAAPEIGGQNYTYGTPGAIDIPSAVTPPDAELSTTIAVLR